MHIAREKGLLGDYYNDRLEVIDHMHELSRRVARMKLLGVAAWKKEDYELAYAIKNGIVKLPQGKLFDPESYMLDGKGDAGNKAGIARGLFNVHRYTKMRTDKWNYQDPFPSLPVTDNYSAWQNPLSSVASHPLEQSMGSLVTNAGRYGNHAMENAGSSGIRYPTTNGGL